MTAQELMQKYVDESFEKIDEALTILSVGAVQMANKLAGEDENLRLELIKMFEDRFLIQIPQEIRIAASEIPVCKEILTPTSVEEEEETCDDVPSDLPEM